MFGSSRDDLRRIGTPARQNDRMAAFVGIDVGTSAAKAILIEESGRIVAQASAEYPLSTPRPGWSEQDPEHWWTAVQACLAEIVTGSVDGIGLTGQMHGAVFLDEGMKVIRPAILWNDQRTAEECAQIDAAVGVDRYREITCNPPMTGLQLPKVLWLRKHEPEAFRRVRHVLLPKDYIRFRLTGTLATDVSDASGTGAFDVPNRRWSQEILSALDVDPSWFPPSFESDERTGLTADGVPVVAGAGDQAAAAMGTGAVRPGIVSISLGTSGVVFGCVEKPTADRNGVTNTFCHANRGWHAMGVMLSCGGALRWYRDVFRPGWSYDAIAAEAETVAPGAEGLVFAPYLSGERCPINDPSLTASFTGATLAHGPAHFSRAVFEGVTRGLAGCYEALAAVGVRADEIRLTGGGAKSAFWRGLLEEALGRPCAPVEIDEGPAYGAACLARTSLLHG